MVDVNKFSIFMRDVRGEENYETFHYWVFSEFRMCGPHGEIYFMLLEFVLDMLEIISMCESESELPRSNDKRFGSCLGLLTRICLLALISEVEIASSIKIFDFTNT